MDSGILMRIAEVATSAGLATLAIYLVIRHSLVRHFTPGQKEIIDRNRAEALLEAREESLRLKQLNEAEFREQRASLERQHAAQLERESQLEKRRDDLLLRERDLASQAEALSCLQQGLHERQQELTQLLSVASNLGEDEAKSLYLKEVVKEFTLIGQAKAREIEESAVQSATEKAKEILVTAMERCAATTVSESSVSVVSLASEDLKGRIIGREGRNIRAFEQASGVDLVIDDAPNTVVLSCFDPFRREIARVALLSLLEDGRIHPSTIEDHLAKSRELILKSTEEAGIDASQRAGVHGLPSPILLTMGKLKFRTSNAQNVLEHSVETAHLGAAIAAELGLNVEVVKAAGFLHDIGKALGAEREGPHALVGMAYLEEQGVQEPILNAVGAHHREIEPASAEASIVIVADAISASRPGARRESLDAYAKRLEALEGIARAFPGVDHAYAIQAGREIRVVVRPDEIDDVSAARLASQIARRIETEMKYPGQIRVTVIRETRSLDFAK